MQTGRRIGPQPGQQYKFSSCPADIAVIGGSAFGGKTYSLLLEGTRWLNYPRIGPVFFRRTLPEIEQEGGAWDKSEEIFYGLGGVPNLNKHKWHFPTGSTFTFAHLQHEKSVRHWLSSQIPVLLIDQAEQFSGKMLWSLIGRNRSDAGLFRPYARLSCNPDPDSYLATFLEWWIDQETGYPIPERDGKIRYLVRDESDSLHWGDTPEEVKPFTRPGVDPMSVCFIRSRMVDNPLGMEADPEYVKRIEAMPMVDRLRYGEGNWKVREGAGTFSRDWFILCDEIPITASRVRWWDTAGTTDGGAFTAGVLLACDPFKRVYVEDVDRFQLGGARRDNRMRQTADLDRIKYGHGIPVVQWKEQEPGGDGKKVAEAFIRLMAGHEAYTEPTSKDKVTMARPFASYCEAGNVFVKRAPWTENFLSEMAAFPHGKYKDQADAASRAFLKVIDMPVSLDTGIYVDEEPSIVGGLPPEVFQ